MLLAEGGIICRRIHNSGIHITEGLFGSPEGKDSPVRRRFECGIPIPYDNCSFFVRNTLSNKTSGQSDF